ncbi:putative sulfoacetate--CoA ligase [compost metagenome]|uniref:class I adenylate-forming enzyme family protein n=1 Tax=Achromobacter sp. Root83 TaxID=1736602 RepID=UPI00070FBF29|nr:class I adenylate-forming enzyme family protein [Achromobacter sp. Root83]KRC85476.1 acid--CoA ligase [Achromobacter sp. Root83]
MTIADATVVAAFARLWSQPGWAARPAIVTAEETLTYADLRRRVGQAAGGLRAAGVAPGHYVAVAMERSLAQVVAMLGAMAAGACPCPLEPRLSVAETARRVAAVGLTWMLHDEANAASAEACGLAPARLLRAADVAQGPEDWSGSGVAPRGPGLLLFTSGSTGNPKGVLLSHQGLANNARGVLAHTGLTPADRLLHVMPLHHTNALNNQIFAPLLAGASVALAGRFRADDMPGLLTAFRPTIITGVPTMYARMLELPFDPAALAGLRFARCGSAPITEALHRRIEAFLGCPLVVSYGLSEATCTSTMNPPAARRVGSVGTVLAGQEVSLRLPDGSRAAAGGEGEICIAGDSLMLGYLGVDDADDGAPALLRTGDLGRFDEQGYLTITGRIKDVIIRGGENISPALIEGVVTGLPGVAACCVVGAPDEDLGEAPVIFVQRNGDAAPDAPRIQAEVLARLGRIYVPREVLWIERLPENAVGKVDRKALARQAAAKDAVH